MKNKNEFEHIIDNYILEEVVKGEADEKILRAKLKSLSTKNKRLGILSILDSNRSLFIKIKDIIESAPIDKLDHIEAIVEYLREYVKVGVTEQKKYGEVFTPYETIEELLNMLPEDTYSNPNLRFLDPCAGVGNFPVVLIQKLMKGLKTWEEDETKRYKHIVENMLYLCELQPKNAFLILCALDPHDEYIINIYNGNFLTEEFDKHSKEVWELDKFDVVMMNPPYQEMDGEKNKNSASPIYHNFILKGKSISSNILSINPHRWMAGGKV